MSLRDAYVFSMCNPSESRACNCVGPQNGDPVCPCMMPDYLQREAGAAALEIMSRMVNKPRVRVKAGRRVVLFVPHGL